MVRGCGLLGNFNGEVIISTTERSLALEPGETTTVHRDGVKEWSYISMPGDKKQIH